MTVTPDQIQALYDAEVVDSEGNKVGGVGQVYLDDETGQPSWVTTKAGLFGTAETFVPLQGAQISSDRIAVPWTKEFIKDAPAPQAEGHLDDTDQKNLFQYYNLGSTGPAADTGRAGDQADSDNLGAEADAARSDTAQADADRADDSAGISADSLTHADSDVADRSVDVDQRSDQRSAQESAPRPPVAPPAPFSRPTGPTADATDAPADTPAEDAAVSTPPAADATSKTAAGDVPQSVVRREEELNVTKERVAAGRMTIRKHVVREQRTVTIPLDREEIEVIREAIADGDPIHLESEGHELSDDEFEVILYAERPIVSKRVVAKERIGLSRSTLTEHHDVTAEIGREEIEFEHDDPADDQPFS